MKTLGILLVLAVLGAAAWFFLGPLFIDQTVDEPFVLVDESGQFNREGVMNLSEGKRQGMRDEIMAAAAGAMEAVVDETMPEEMMRDGAPVVVSRGQFRDADPVHAGSGTATLYQLPDGTHLVRFEDFETTNGPDLVVYLSTHPDPRSADDVAQNDYVELGPLKGNIGNQNYLVPAATDIDSIGSVVIWCELFGVLFSPAPLAAPSA